MATSDSERGSWGSSVGFVLAAAGSAIGLGNIWRFPYTAGEGGGGAFVLVYLLCVVALGLPVMLLEISLGRATQKNPVGAIKAIRPDGGWKALGYLALVTGLGILSYYAVIAGRVLDLFVSYLIHAFGGGDAVAHGSSGWTILFLALFLVGTASVVSGGVQAGIERWTKLLMPLLLVIMLGVIVRGLMLPGAMEGVRWLLAPDFSKLDRAVVMDAMAQAFFSLSLGMGAMLTYGSYLSKKSDILSCAGWVVLFDTGIAILAGFMIFPAVFALGFDPAAGPALIFNVLPGVFGAMSGGKFVGAVFFLLLSVAALTSTISLLEVVSSFFIDELGWTRRKTVWCVAGLTCVVGIPSALDFVGVAPFNEISVLGQTGFLSIMDFIWGNLSLVVGAFFLCLFASFAWGMKAASDEIESTSPGFHRFRGIWGVFVRFVCPVLIAAIIVTLVWGAVAPAEAPPEASAVETEVESPPPGEG